MRIHLKYQGKNWISRNKIDSLHWTKRKEIKEALWKEIPHCLLEVNDLRNKQFKIFVEYNNRYDTDNIVGSFKFALDYFKQNEYITDDNKKWFKELNVVYNNTLPTNTIVMIITAIDVPNVSTTASKRGKNSNT
jgi:hypothetical protein